MTHRQQQGGTLFAQVKILPEYKQPAQGDYTQLAVEEGSEMNDTERLFGCQTHQSAQKTDGGLFTPLGSAKVEISGPETEDVFPQLLESERDHLQDENENLAKQKTVGHCVFYLDDEEKKENEVFQALPRRARERWSRAALAVSVVSVCTTLGFSVASFAASRVTSSSSMFASAFDALLGSFNWIIVAWRFRDSLNGKVAPRREKSACFVIALSFIIGGVCMGTESSFRLADHTHPHKPDILLIILSSSFICYMLLFYAQNCIALKLRSASMKAAAVDSALAALMSIGIFASTYVYRIHPRLWYLDHSLALSLGLISLIYGIKLLVDVTCCKKERLQWLDSNPSNTHTDEVEQNCIRTINGCPYCGVRSFKVSVL